MDIGEGGTFPYTCGYGLFEGCNSTYVNGTASTQDLDRVFGGLSGVICEPSAADNNAPNATNGESNANNGESSSSVVAPTVGPYSFFVAAILAAGTVMWI